jgi:uncharacterized coiled-coil protein SlyX
MSDITDGLRAAIDAATDTYFTKLRDDAVAFWRDQVGALDDKLSSATGELASTKAALDEAIGSLQASTAQITTLSEQLAAAQFRIAGLNDQVDSLLARIAELEAQLPVVLKNTKVGAAATAKPGQTYPTGIHSDTGEWRRLQTLVGKPLLARRTFESVPASFSALKAAQDLGDPETVHVISFKPSLDTVGSPGWIAWAEGLINSFPAGDDVKDREWVFTVQHEASAKPLDIAKFKACFRSFADVVSRLKGERRMTMAWIETGWLFAPASGKNALDWSPGDDVVDMVAPDPYNLNPAKYYALNQADIVGAVQAYEFAKAHGKRFGIAEWGCNDTTASNRAKFITDGTAWAKALGRAEGDTGPVCEFLAWFHSDVPTTDTNDFFLDSSATSLAAYKATV